MHDVLRDPGRPDRLRAQTVPDLIAERVQRTRHDAAWRVAGADGSWETIDWVTYAREIETVAGALNGLGVHGGDRVAIMAPVSLRWEIADKALLSLGGVVVGVDLHASREDRDFILRDAAVTGCIISRLDDLRDLDQAIVDRLRFIVTLDSTGASGDPRARSWEALRAGTAKPHASAPPGANDVATLIYTSGTTGTPKPITYTHGQLALACAALLEAFAPITALDRGVCWLPLSNMFQRVMNLCSIGAGSQTYFVEDPRRIMDHLSGIAPTILIGVPRLYEKIYRTTQERLTAAPGWQRHLVDRALHVGARVAGHRRAGRRVPFPTSTLHHLLDAVVLQRFRAPFGGAIRFMVSGSAPLPPAIMQFFESAGLLILEAYGSSENIVPIAVNRPADYRAGSVGKPLPPNEVRLAADGEVLVRSPGLFSGYENGATAAQLVDGFYATGDFGEFDGDGFLFLRGRKSEVLKTSTGRRIAPSRIELLLRQIPGVDQALAFGDGREVLVGMLALEPGQATQEVARAVQSVNERLADYERIRGLLLLHRGLTVASGELTSNLKPRRRVIAERFQRQLEQLYEELRKPGARDSLPIVVAPS